MHSYVLTYLFVLFVNMFWDVVKSAMEQVGISDT